jgi:hypothetical protein
VVRAVHDESYVGRDHTEFTDDKLIINKIEVVLYVLLKVHNVLKIIVISKVPYDDVGVRDDVFQEAKAVVVG